MKAFAHDTPEKKKPINHAPVRKFTSLRKISKFYYLFFLQASASYKCLFALPSPFCAGI